jgi:hypothetical protein
MNRRTIGLHQLLAWATCASFGFLSSGCQETSTAQKTDAAPTQEIEYPEPDEANLSAFVELARQNIQLEKATIIAQNLPLTQEEAAEFWPLHREYQGELMGLNDKKLDLIQHYIAMQASMTDEQARVLAKDVFDLEEKRTDLKRKYFEKFQEAISATQAARFFQIENQLNMVLDLRLAAALPLIR